MTTVATAKEAITWVLETSGLTKYALAKSLGVTPSMINRYLEGSNASKKVASRLLTHYGVEVLQTREVGRQAVYNFGANDEDN